MWEGRRTSYDTSVVVIVEENSDPLAEQDAAPYSSELKCELCVLSVE
jgi:hypothetical protein